VTLYEQLGIEQTAPAQEIKRAYFRLIRQFTPEKDPEAFMRLRQAYETLSDQTRRTAYDASLSRFADTSGEVTSVIMQAEQLDAKGLLADAVNLLEQSEYSSHHDVQLALCRLFLEMGKSGKAVKIIDKLAADRPDSADCLRLAVKAYTARGWTNKACEFIDALERLDPGNEDNTTTLLLGKINQSTLLWARKWN